MAGIAGIASKNAETEVQEMLNTIRHRGKEGMTILEKNGTTIGLVWNETEDELVKKYLDEGIVVDGSGTGHLPL